MDAALTATESSRRLSLFCVARSLSVIVIDCREVGALKYQQIKILLCRVQTIDDPRRMWR